MRNPAKQPRREPTCPPRRGKGELVPRTGCSVPRCLPPVVAGVSLLSVSLLLALAPPASATPFFKYCCDFEPSCRPSTCSLDSEGVARLSCDNPQNEGSGSMVSRGWYQYGVFSVSMKLPKGYSGGVVPAIFLRSGPRTQKAADGQQQQQQRRGPDGTGEPHVDDGERDGSSSSSGEGEGGGAVSVEGVEKEGEQTRITWEFLGAEHPRNMTLHTNLFADNLQHLHQFKFPFDPSEQFHTYSIRWNAFSIAWMVDWSPIRILHRNKRKPWPNQPMQFQLTVTDASWAPHKSNYELSGPVTVEVRDISLRGCEAAGPDKKAPKKCLKSKEMGSEAPWNGPLEAWQYSAWRIINATHLINAYDWDAA